MEQTTSGDIFIITTLTVVLLVATVITLFVVFQRRKNSLLEKQEEQRKQFEREITETQIEIREETLRNISWELHDNIGQLLTLAKIQLQHAAPDTQSEISDTITKSLVELRSLSKVINPEFIKNIKLQEAITLEIERFNRLNYINAKLTVKGEEREIDKKDGVIIFRMLQEFFSNTIKHSKATHLEVVLDYREDQLAILAKDNGVGFDMKEVKGKGIGVKNIIKRADIIKAKAKLASVPQEGTTLKINYYFSPKSSYNITV